MRAVGSHELQAGRVAVQLLSVVLSIFLISELSWSAEQPIGQFVKITSPVDDRLVAHVSQVANDLLSRSQRENRPAILVLEIEPGTSQLHQVLALSRLLTSNQFSALKTLAWVPETITGPNALTALSCREIVMHPDAELGDLSRGQPLEAEDEQLILAIAQKRLNPLVSTALIKGMLDPKQQLWLVRLQTGPANMAKVETRVASREEMETLKSSGVVIERADVLKEAGVLGTFRGSVARDQEILVSQTATTRVEVAQLYHLPREALREAPADHVEQRLQRVRMDGVIDTLQESFLMRQIDRAVHSGANTLILEIESPGGELLASINLAQAIADLDQRQVRTIAYIPRQALSGAAIVALGCDEIYMHPEATIGDAGPIELRPNGRFERAPEKILSPLRAALKTLAERKGRPVALCEAMADRSLKVFQATNRDTGRVWYLSDAEIQASAGEWNVGPQVREANGELLLTLDGQRAHELQIAERSVRDLDDLKIRLGVPASLRLNPIERNWVDTLVFVLNNPVMVMLLFMIAIGSLYLELHFPSGFFGIISSLCFAVFFWSKFLGGTAGWLEVILFGLGAGCLALEIFVLPGFGVFGLSGILLLLASVLMASQSWGNLEPLADIRQATSTLLAFGGSITAVIVMALVLGRFLPHTPMFEGMVLSPPGQPETSEPQLSPQLRESQAVPETSGWVGKQGQAVSFLRPAGKGEFDGRLFDVISEGPFIPEGAALEVVQQSGNRIVVRRISPEPT